MALPRYIRYPLIPVCLLASVGVLFLRMPRMAGLLFAAALILIALGPSEAEKKGYRF